MKITMEKNILNIIMKDGDDLLKFGASDLTEGLMIGMETRYFECSWELFSTY